MKFMETTLKDAFLIELERPENKRSFFECQNVPGVPDRIAGNLRNRRNKEMHKIMAVPHSAQPLRVSRAPWNNPCGFDVAVLSLT